MLSVVRSGLSAASQEISVISNNIANASSLGFKRSSASFSDIYTEMSDVRNGNRVGNGVSQNQPRRNHSQGSLILTGNALDLGMNGQGMFILDTQEKLGELSYTRNGAITIQQDGKLINSDGLSYLDINEQPITLPFQILGKNGTVENLSEVKVTAEGFLKATYGIDNYKIIAQIGLARFADENQLIKILNPLFNSNSVWNSHGQLLLAQYFLAKSEKQKAKEFLEKIINSDNSNVNIKNDARKILLAEFSE